MTNQPRIFTNEASFTNPTPDLYLWNNPQTGTSYTVVASDLGSLTAFNNASAVAVTLPAASNIDPLTSYGTGGGANVPQVFCRGWWAKYKNEGAGTVTISGSIDGGSSITLATGEWCELWCNGTGYKSLKYTIASGGSSPTWTAWTPTISANAGTFTSVSATGRYSTVGKIVFVAFKVNIVTNGTASSYIKATLPSTPAAHGNIIHGKEIAINGKAQQAEVVSSSTTMILSQYDGGYAGADGAVLEYSGFYEIP